MRKMKRSAASVLLAAMMAVGTLAGFAPAGTAEAAAEKVSGVSGAEEKARVTSGMAASDMYAADYVEGEAIVCYKAQPGQNRKTQVSGMEEDVQAEETLKEAAEESLEKEACVVDAEPLLVLGDVDETLISQAKNAVDLQADDASLEAGVDEDTPGVITLVKSDRLTTKELIARLEQQEDVLYAEPNYKYSLQSTDLTGGEWYTQGTYGIGVDGWNTYGDDTPTVDTSQQVVAIIDTGVDYNHEDLKSVMWNEGLNYPTLVEMGGGMYGYNAVQFDSDGEPDDPSNPMDLHGHGTHCAGIVAGAWNHTGVSGVTSGAKLMAVRIFNDSLFINTDIMIRAYEYVIAAKKAGVNVVATNNSYGGVVLGVTENLVLEEAGKLGIVCVFAAGNENKDLNETTFSSAMRGRYGHVVVVGASMESGKRAPFSNYGERDVDVFAPGTNIWSTVRMGTGGPNLDTHVLSMNGTTYTLDYSDKTDTTDDLFGFNGKNMDFSVKTAEDGKNVLHAEYNGTSETMEIRTKKYEDLTSCQGILFRLWTEKETGISYEVYEVYEDESEYKLKSGYLYMQPGINQISVPYPTQEYGDSTKKDVTIRFDLESANVDMFGKLKSVDIREIRFTDTMENYESWNGTSMATPVVTGSVAILAAKYPEDSAEKLAARVKGSVFRNDYFEGRCASDGLFRLDKALAGETYPVPGKATVEGDSFTVDGYFFGTEKGTLKIGERECTVTSWTDTKIVAELPEDFEAGEYMVEVIASNGSGHRYLRMGTAKNLATRLSLPGSTFSESGEYVIGDDVKAEYGYFYSGDVKALVPLNGYIYAVFATPRKGTEVFRYKISADTWEKVSGSEEYLPLGAVAWNGKLVILGSNPPKNKAAIGIMDPKTAKFTWKIHNKESFEEKTSIVNNGYGIYLIGGREVIYGNDKNACDYGSIRRLDPVKMTVTELEEDDYGPYGYALAVASDAEGRIYYMTGENIDKPSEIVISWGEINKEKAKELKTIKNPKLFEDISLGGGMSNSFVVTKDGLLMTGPFVINENETVETDTWLIGFDGKTSKKLPKVISYRPAVNHVSVGYRGKFYVMGQTIGEASSYVFASMDADVTEPYGETTYQDEWVNGTYYGKDSFRSYDYPEKGRWRKDSNGWWYSVGKGKYLKNCWAKIDGTWYFFGRDGYMEKDAYRKGWHLGKNGAWDGAAKAEGWKKDDTGWFYVSGKGQYLKNGWKKIDGNWYYFRQDGYMAANEWVQGYWLNKNGVCTYPRKAGWKKDKNGWWYGDGKWFAKNQWQKIDGKWYYFDEKGYIVTGTRVIGGTEYRFDADGVYVGN